MQRLEVSGAVRPIYGSLGVKRLKTNLSNTPHHITSPSKWLSFELRKTGCSLNKIHSVAFLYLCHVKIQICFIPREDTIIYVQGSLQYDVLFIIKPFLHRNKITQE